jgi:hypothetical protein
MSTTDRRLEKIVILAIVDTLLKISKGTLDNIQSRLSQEYKCSIQDCYEHPEYMDKVLKDMFGPAYHGVILDVNRYLMNLLTRDQQ